MHDDRHQRLCEHFCNDCGHRMDVIRQQTMRGDYITLVTCWSLDCLLNAVTLSVEQYDTLTECQLEAYREMNRNSRPKYVSA